MVCHHKWQTRTVFYPQEPKTPILPIFGGQLQKIVNFYFKKFNVKMTFPWTLFTKSHKKGLNQTIRTSVWWYAKVGGDITSLPLAHHLPKVTKKDWISTQTWQFPAIYSWSELGQILGQVGTGLQETLFLVFIFKQLLF